MFVYNFFMVRKIVTNKQIDTEKIFKDVPYSPNKLIFCDIETTGLSRQANHIYLIGLGQIKGNTLSITQYFAESVMDERNLLSDFAKDCSLFLDEGLSFVTYNGDKFDMPFINTRLEEHNIAFAIPEGASLDLYHKAKSLSSVVKLPNHRQKTIEIFLHIDRDDIYTGRELIKVYNTFQKTGNEKLVTPLLLHNLDDVAGLCNLFSIYSAEKIYLNLKKQLDVSSVNIKKNTYKDYSGNESEETIIKFELTRELINPINIAANGFFLKAEKNTGVISVKEISTCLKYFFADYKNYYYLPEEDSCIHKDLAAFVESSHKEKAKPENCFVKKDACFIPILCQSILFNGKELPVFKENNNSTDCFIEIDDTKRTDDAFWRAYIKANITENLS